MDLFHAIYHRRSIRHYTDVPVHPAMLQDLLKAAVQAPSAVNQQPWAFAVVRGRKRLNDYSDRAKVHLLSILPQTLNLHQRSNALSSESYNVFHDAGTLVAICARPAMHHPAEDCLLAAQNFMLAAYGLGLGTCAIGFVRPWLNLPEIKQELGIPENYTVIMPLIVGWPDSIPPATLRAEPEIVCWHDDDRKP